MAIKPIFGTVDALKKKLENLSVEDLKREMAERKNLLLVDIREIQETVDLGTIPGAVHAPRGMLEFWVDPESPYHKDVFASGKRFVLYCQSGWRSALAAQTVTRMGLERVCHVGGGFSAWKESGGPVETVPERR